MFMPLPSYVIFIDKQIHRCKAEKIKAIYDGLTALQDSSVPLLPDEVFQSEHCFTNFTPVTKEEVGKIIKGTALKVLLSGSHSNKNS